MQFLLDVNLLIALAMPGHEFHESAHKWFRKDPQRRWATCPLTQAGFLRVASRSLGGTRDHLNMAIELLEINSLSSNHEYWPVDVDLRDLDLAQRQHLIGPNQVADLQLLSLAHRRRGQLATFDKGIRELAVGTRYASSYCCLL